MLGEILLAFLPFCYFLLLFLISELNIYSTSMSIPLSAAKRAVCLPIECEL